MTGASPGAPPRILHVFPTFALGGSQRRFAAVANHFGNAFRHIIWPLDGNCEAESLLAPNDAWTIERGGFARRGLIGGMRAARREMLRHNIDLIVTHNWGSIEWAAANLIPLARHVHIEDGFGPEEASRQLLRRVWFRRLVLNWHSTLVVPSLTLHKLAREVWRIRDPRLRYVPNGINCARFGIPPEIVFTEARQRGATIVGTVATLRAEKALGRLIEAIDLLRSRCPLHLVIVGDGSERELLQQDVAARKLQDFVTFTGPLAQPERILNAFDIFAMSSDTEQMPLSLLEAMAAGLPVASTDAGDVAFLLAEENRRFVVNKSASALAAAIFDLARDPEQRARLGAANRAKALTEFDQARMFDAYEALFRGRPLRELKMDENKSSWPDVVESQLKRSA